MTTRLRAAVIGCGRMGCSAAGRDALFPAGWLPLSHSEALLRTGRIELVGFCDTDERRLAECGSHYGVTALYTDYCRMLDELHPAIVSVATRTPPKVGIVREACASGVKGLYVEKPVANSLADCQLALNAIRESGVHCFYGVNRRYHATYRRALELVRSGEIGEIRQVTVEHGRSQLLWSHPHSADLLLQFSGSTEPVDVHAYLAGDSMSILTEKLVDSDPIVEHATFRFANGVIGTISRASGLNLRVAGTQANLTVHADGSLVQIDRSIGAYFLDRRVIRALDGRGATVTALTELADVVESGVGSGEILAGIEAGLRMLLGCVWSHLQGNRTVSLSDVPPDLAVTGRYGDVVA